MPDTGDNTEQAPNNTEQPPKTELKTEDDAAPEAAQSRGDAQPKDGAELAGIPRPQHAGDDAFDAVVVEEPLEPSADGGSVLPFAVAGIGASAGGVEAYIELFRSLPVDTGIAFVLIPHLAADHKSLLPEILRRQTLMQVEEIRDGVRPEPNRIYVLPAGGYAIMKGGVLRLVDRHSDEGAIDVFFRSLAAEQKLGAIGVVLSGADADGAMGLKTIRGEGGFAIVQEPDSARYAEMPRTSILGDNVDRVLPPGQIGTELALMARQFTYPGLRPQKALIAQPSEDQSFTRIINMLRGVSGVDVRHYKPSTIRRRIARRMVLHRIHSLTEYAAFLQGNQKEQRQLQEDALINVTRFFRDPPVFQVLRDVILPRVFERREHDQQIRIWVAGCSSGEEVYSIAIGLLEYLAGQAMESSVQIFGTDASDANVVRARAGIYPESITVDVSPERMRRFFVKTEKGYQVAKRVRDLCIFTRQNLCSDPPFSKMDLISCRNVLIYLGAELQKQILQIFHYALRPNGYLLLGMSEAIRELTDLFQLADRRHKFFAKVGNDASKSPPMAPRFWRDDLSKEHLGVALMEKSDDLELQRAADRIVLARYGPPGVVIDAKMDVLQVRGHAAPFIEVPSGSVSLQLGRMLRHSIGNTVTQAVRRAIDEDVPVRAEGLRVTMGEETHELTLEVLPMRTVASETRRYLVLFTPAQQAQAELETRAGAPSGPGPGQPDAVIARLRHDLTVTKTYLRTLLEERDARTQELVSANEEIQSANEELQSMNEELETTQEELQSSNEELQTVNDELHQRNASLTQTSNDLTNLLNSVNMPVLMLSSELLIRHFTPPTQRLMNLRPADIGRPFSDIRLNLSDGDLEPVLQDVLDSLTPREMEVKDRDGRRYLLRVRPYRTSENKIEGLVVAMVDIDQLRRSQHELRAARDLASSIIEGVPLALAVVDLELKVRAANDAFRSLAGFGKEGPERRFLPDLTSAAWGLDEPLRSSLEGLRLRKDGSGEFAFEHSTTGENPRFLQIRGRVLRPDSEMFLLVTIADITNQRAMERRLELERQKMNEEIASAGRELRHTQDELRSLTAGLFTMQEEERRRVARDLHDDICQRLTVLELDLQEAERMVANDPDRAQGEIDKLRKSVVALAGDVRHISHGLHPSVIEDLGATAALRSLVDDFREREQMIVTFNAQNVPRDVPVEVATGLYRITQEALRNVARHAGRTHVKVLIWGDSGVHLQISDSGEGFDVQEHPQGLGLISMEERARLMGGAFTIRSNRGEGTRVVVHVPARRTE